MSEKLEIRWKIEAYSPCTMPLNRLLDYMRELTTMLAPYGPELHLIRIDEGSTIPVFYTDADHAAPIHERGAEIRSGTADPGQITSYRHINHMLHQDGARAVLYEADGEREAEIIPFPGAEEGPPLLKKLRQQGSVDGRLFGVGGVGERAPVVLKKPDGTVLRRLSATHELAKELGHHMQVPVRLYGTGQWTLSEDGHWTMDHFFVDRFEKLDDAPLSEVVKQLRAVKADWPDDPIAEILDEAAE
jgi:hypothetical protein